MMLVNNSNKVKLVCRVKSRDTQTVISWRKDGEAVEEVGDERGVCELMGRGGVYPDNRRAD